MIALTILFKAVLLAANPNVVTPSASSGCISQPVACSRGPICQDHKELVGSFCDLQTCR
ncbi:hypothetical protein HMPREF9337_02340 [Cutibacterium acnes HL096PA3]|nr:hypothetical protein HMPREF9574_02051 [Cutibacterium acnes HL074PA1]EFS42225.1 hypothetical protein HMPREF9575_00108 [Cutibacterium acnes HL110PA1]EFS47120.1 hypothetical protein HMPREF9580_00295 [Cutibacterium acnes HL087PA2]EFS54763.1 hypothetical protein HMPREF9589_00002 [Cutibacterium acnes HL059PA1]EFS58901.1 hypothetical protein HMPREF9604_01145 [Cutibacterium acnes HL036PA1]EFS61578.1 hypothetical protein HMPREF9605_01042 [Cutibacterium acnes HL036PA2]EFS66945.1 hypothetical protein